MHIDGETSSSLSIIGAERNPSRSVVECKGHLLVADLLVQPKLLRSIHGGIELEVDVDIGVWWVGDGDCCGYGASSDGYGEDGWEGDADGGTGDFDCVFAECAVVGRNGSLLFDEIEGVGGGDQVLADTYDEGRS